MDTPYCTLFLCLLFHAAAMSPAPVNLTAAEGEAVIFPLEIPEETNFDHIIWSSESRRKAVAMILRGQPLSVLLPELSGRLTTLDRGYSLKISNLTMRDGGLYTAKMTTPSDTIQLKQYQLRIYANPPAPASPTSLSYCRIKGLILLLVLGALSAGIIAVHVLLGREQRRG